MDSSGQAVCRRATFQQALRARSSRMGIRWLLDWTRARLLGIEEGAPSATETHETCRRPDWAAKVDCYRAARIPSTASSDGLGRGASMNLTHTLVE
jgi:hypothetical protein